MTGRASGTGPSTSTDVAALFEDADPAVQALAHRDLLGQGDPGDAALASPLVRALLAGLTDAGTMDAPYVKWTGAHWRLVSLVELGIPAGEEGAVAAVAACDRVLDHWAGSRRLAAVPVADGRARRCASQEGNAVAVACLLGLGDDDRVRVLAQHLRAWQWPDGGWNCDKHPDARHSSVNETLPALWGLHEYATATGDTSCRASIRAAAEVLLARELLFSRRTGLPIHPVVVEPHYPPYWHYDLLQALLVLQRAGFAADPRTRRARLLMAGRRRADGTWRAGRRWWRPPGATGRGVEAVDWADGAHQMVTLNALRVGAEERAGV